MYTPPPRAMELARLISAGKIRLTTPAPALRLVTAAVDADDMRLRFTAIRYLNDTPADYLVPSDYEGLRHATSKT